MRSKEKVAKSPIFIYCCFAFAASIDDFRILVGTGSTILSIWDLFASLEPVSPLKTDVGLGAKCTFCLAQTPLFNGLLCTFSSRRAPSFSEPCMFGMNSCDVVS